MILVSACLCGVSCRYDGSSAPCEEALDLLRKGQALLVCPEQLGGLSTPRPPVEIKGWDGMDVLRNAAKVVTADGVDVSAYYLRGAEETVRLAKLVGVERAMLKDKSPSCGCGVIYDGSFTGRLRQGNGVTAAALRAAGFAVEPK